MSLEILAHRTGVGLWPPNSLEGLKMCHGAGISGAECDITFTKDKKPIVWVNDSNELLAPRPHSIGRLDFETASRLLRKDTCEKLLGIERILEFVETHDIKIYLDVKYYERHGVGNFLKMPRAMLELVRALIIKPAQSLRVADRLGFVTFCGGIELLREAKRENSLFATNLIIIFPWTRLASYDFIDSITIGWETHNHWLLFPKSLAKIVDNAKSKKIKVYAGLIKSEQELPWVWRFSFDGIWTDNVQKFKKMLNQSRDNADG